MMAILLAALLQDEPPPEPAPVRFTLGLDVTLHASDLSIEVEENTRGTTASVTISPYANLLLFDHYSIFLRYEHYPLFGLPFLSWPDEVSLDIVDVRFGYQFLDPGEHQLTLFAGVLWGHYEIRENLLIEIASMGFVDTDVPGDFRSSVGGQLALRYEFGIGDSLRLSAELGIRYLRFKFEPDPGVEAEESTGGFGVVLALGAGWKF